MDLGLLARRPMCVRPRQGLATARCLLRSMSALGQKQTYALQQAMSALPPIAAAKTKFRKGNVCFSQKADIPFASGVNHAAGFKGLLGIATGSLISPVSGLLREDAPMMPLVFELIIMLAVLTLGFVLGRIWEIRRQTIIQQKHESADLRIPTAHLPQY